MNFEIIQRKQYNKTELKPYEKINRSEYHSLEEWEK